MFGIKYDTNKCMYQIRYISSMIQTNVWYYDIELSQDIIKFKFYTERIRKVNKQKKNISKSQNFYI